MLFFDSHCHLNDEKFNDDKHQIIKKLVENDISKFIIAGYSLESSIKSLEISKNYDFIYSTCGISPNDIPQDTHKLWKQIDEIESLAKSNKKFIAIGEIGLDYYWNKDNSNLQKQVFIRQIEIANKLDLPIVIHTRDARIDTINILKEHIVKEKGVFHCCPQNQELIKQALNLGFYISFAGPITFKNSKNADEIINLVPNDRILIETDSPYLAPEPIRGTLNTPANVKYIAQKIADVKELSLQEIAKITYNNTCKIFKI